MILAVAGGGVIGAAARLAFAEVFPNVSGHMPWTTLAENVLGAFLLGLVLAGLLERWRPRRDVRPFLCTGILGSFTTFSNYTVEIVELADGRTGLAAAYALASIGAGLAAGMAGMAMARVRWRSAGDEASQAERAANAAEQERGS